jgi:hypothetical protein
MAQTLSSFVPRIVRGGFDPAFLRGGFDFGSHALGFTKVGFDAVHPFAGVIHPLHASAVSRRPANSHCPAESLRAVVINSKFCCWRSKE